MVKCKYCSDCEMYQKDSATCNLYEGDNCGYKRKLSKIKINLLFLILSLTLILSGGVMAVGTYPALDPDMVLYYHFNNDSAYGENDTHVFDFSGNNYNLTASGSTYFNSTGGFLGDGAFEYSGSGGYFKVVNFTGVSGSTEITEAAWLKPTAIQPAASRAIATANDNLYMSGYAPYFAGIKEQDGSALISDSTWRTIKNPNEWHWIVQIYSISSDHTELYIDGELATTQDHLNNQSKIGDDTLFIGWEGLSTRYFNGTIDEVIIWNRSLSSDEIKQVYSNYIGNNLKINMTKDFNSIIINNTNKNINISISDSILKNLSVNINNRSYDIFKDLLLYYSFDNNSILGENDSIIVDLSGNSMDRYTTNTSFETGKYGKALKFAGTASSQIAFTSEHYYNYNSSGSFTASMWILFRKDNSGCNGQLIYDGSASSSWNIRVCNNPQFNLYNTSGSRFLVSDGSNQAPRTTSYNTTISAEADNLNTWHFITFRYDAVNKYAQVDMDEKIYGYRNITGEINNSWKIRTNIGNLFNGSLDNLMVYNRYLSDDELFLLYNSNLQKINQTDWNLAINYDDIIFIGNNSLSVSGYDYGSNFNSTATFYFFLNKTISIKNPIILDDKYFIDNFEDYNIISDINYNWLLGEGIEKVINESYIEENLSWSGNNLIRKPLTIQGSLTTTLGNMNTQSAAVNNVYNTFNGFSNFTYLIKNEDLYLEALNYQTSWIGYRWDWQGCVDNSSAYFSGIRNNYTGGASANSLMLRHRYTRTCGFPYEVDVMATLNNYNLSIITFNNNVRTKNWKVITNGLNITTYINDEIAFSLYDNTTNYSDPTEIKPTGTFGIRWAGTGVIGRMDDLFIYENPKSISNYITNLSVGFVFDSENNNLHFQNFTVKWYRNGNLINTQTTLSPDGTSQNWNNTLTEFPINYTININNLYDNYTANIFACANATDYISCNNFQTPIQYKYSNPFMLSNNLINNTLNYVVNLTIQGLSSALLTNGTSLCNGSTGLMTGNVNITLNPNDFCYVLDNFDLTNGIIREHSPVNITSIVTTDSSKTYSISSLINEDIIIPVYNLVVPNGYSLTSVTIIPKDKSSYNPSYTYDLTTRRINIPAVNLSYSTSSNKIILGLTTQAQADICERFFDAGNGFVQFAILFIIVACAGFIIYLIMGEGSEIDLTTIAGICLIAFIVLVLGMKIINSIGSC